MATAQPCGTPNQQPVKIWLDVDKKEESATESYFNTLGVRSKIFEPKWGRELGRNRYVK